MGLCATDSRRADERELEKTEGEDGDTKQSSLKSVPTALPGVIGEAVDLVSELLLKSSLGVSRVFGEGTKGNIEGDSGADVIKPR